MPRKYKCVNEKSPKNIQKFKIILRHILEYRNDSNCAHTLLSTIHNSYLFIIFIQKRASHVYTIQ